MKTKHLPCICFIAAFVVACKKNDPKPQVFDDRPPEQVVASLTQELSKSENLSDFSNALKDIQLKKEDVSEGLTIFAPLNETAQNASVKKGLSNIRESLADSPGAFTDQTLKDHLVKGVLKFQDLSNGKVLTTLSGKQLKITIDSGLFYINGVMVNREEIALGTREAIYAVRKRLCQTNISDTIAKPVDSVETTEPDPSDTTSVPPVINPGDSTSTTPPPANPGDTNPVPPVSNPGDTTSTTIPQPGDSSSTTPPPTNPNDTTRRAQAIYHPVKRGVLVSLNTRHMTMPADERLITLYHRKLKRYSVPG